MAKKLEFDSRAPLTVTNFMLIMANCLPEDNANIVVARATEMTENKTRYLVLKLFLV